jgi:hypothetical protein
MLDAYDLTGKRGLGDHQVDAIQKQKDDRRDNQVAHWTYHATIDIL